MIAASLLVLRLALQSGCLGVPVLVGELLIQLKDLIGLPEQEHGPMSLDLLGLILGHEHNQADCMGNSDLHQIKAELVTKLGGRAVAARQSHSQCSVG